MTIVTSRMEDSQQPAVAATEASKARWRSLLQPRALVLAVSLAALVATIQSVGGGRAATPPAPEQAALVSDSKPAPEAPEPALAVTADDDAGDADARVATAVDRPVTRRPAPPKAEPVDVRPPAGRVQVDRSEPASEPTESSEPSEEPSEPAAVDELELEPVKTQLPRIKLAEAEEADRGGARQMLSRTDATAVEEEPRQSAGDVVSKALAIEGVAFATSVEIGEVRVTSPAGVEKISVAAVDPEGFRVLTPQVTADSDGVWQRISEGDAAFTHDVGTRLELELGSRVPAAADRRSSLRVGAYASNGVPPVADAIISRATAAELGLEGTRTLLVSIADDADPEAVAAELGSVTGMQADLIDEPETRRAFLTGAAARDAFEPFSYVSIGDGMIQIDRDWVQRNIVSADVPILRGHVTCHRQMIPQLRGALQEILDRGLADLIDPSQYGGCWVPRHILFNPGRAISNHAWGLAIDLNVRGNEYGNRNPEMDPRIVEIFERWGFSWGGRWSTPDGMHFELTALLQDGGEGG